MSMQVFISYKSQEKSYAEEIAKQLHAEGFVPWYDTILRAGDEWKEVIDNAIKDSLAIIVIITPASMTSHYVTYEWSFARGLGKRVIPIIYKDPTEKIHPKLHSNSNQQISRFSDEDWDKQLISALRETHQSEVIPPTIAESRLIIQSIKSKDLWDEAVAILERSNHPASLDILLEAMDGDIPVIVRKAALAFSSKRAFKDERSIIALKRVMDEALETPKLQEHPETVLAAMALGKIGTVETIEILIDVYDQVETSLPLGENIPLSLGFAKKEFNKAQAFLRQLLKEQANLITIGNDSSITISQPALLNTIKALIKLRDEESLDSIHHIIENTGVLRFEKIHLEALRANILLAGNQELSNAQKRIIENSNIVNMEGIIEAELNAIAELGTPEAIHVLTDFATPPFNSIAKVTAKQLLEKHQNHSLGILF